MVQKAAAVPAGIKFDMVEEVHLLSGGSNRTEAALTLKPTGFGKTNTELKDGVMGLVEEAGVNRERFRLAFGVNKDLGVIALYVASWETKGAMPVRVSPNALTFHLGGVLRKYPTLRPNTTVEPEASITTDADGRKCVAFNILTALPKQKRRKKKSSGDPTATGQAQAAAASTSEE